jgi:hypothetical protein
VDKLNIRSGPGTNHAVIGQLSTGDLALVIDGGEAPESWAHVATDGAVGYVNTGPQEHPWLQSTPTPWKAYSTYLAGVASSGSTYLAYGNAGERDYSPYEGGNASLLLRSDDGVTWTEPSDGPYGTVTAVAGGPAGWVALSYGYPDVSLATYSRDGRTWEDKQPIGSPAAIAYGPAGWVVLSGNQTSRSADGRSWSNPVAFPAGVIAEGVALDRLESSEAGYVAFSRGGYGAGRLWVSPDGAKWVAVDLADDATWIADVELTGKRLLVVLRAGTDSQSTDGHSLLLRGIMAASGTVTWDAAAIPFADGLLVDSISQGAGGLIALGWDVEALVPVLWRSADGASWQRLDTAEGVLGGSVGPEPAWGAGGWVGLGTAVGGTGQQLWRSPDGASWSPSGDPIVLRSRPPCPPSDEVSVLVLMYLGPYAEQCFGQTSLAVRGWVPFIEGLGGCCYPVSEPNWLAGPYPGGYLMPGEEPYSAGLSLYLPPGVDPALLKPETWAEVVGHFRDDAAASCRRTPVAMFPPSLLESRASVQLDCRQRFVVESITTGEGP